MCYWIVKRVRVQSQKINKNTKKKTKTSPEKKLQVIDLRRLTYEIYNIILTTSWNIRIIINLLDTTTTQTSKFGTKNWIVINNDEHQ